MLHMSFSEPAKVILQTHDDLFREYIKLNDIFRLN